MICLEFRADVSGAAVDGQLLPSDGGVGFSVSASTSEINRRDLMIVSSAGRTEVRIDSLDMSDLSDSTEQAIIDAVPATHIQTREVDQ
ncbi:hypothetical protein [Halovenus marina]|uniref:hypothetical protein n=1 Tax=Halovenus marina TaxID=3396621 RepID=UPI003F578B37